MARRSSLDNQRENYVKSQIVALQKALNKEEIALKQKHARILIVGTHKEKSAAVFWTSSTRIQLEKHQILSWKFCHLLHKLFRDGHSRVITDSIRYRSRITDLGTFWHHLRDGYGKLISSYCKMLANRLAFHQRNPNIPGSLQLSDNQLTCLSGNDVNTAYELAVEILDQMDDLLALQKDVFNSMDMSRANSLTASGQCRLAPVILVILDISKFYDYLVKIIFRLHSSLQADTLTGHRDRFDEQFKFVKQLYYSSSNLQYFKFLVSIPTLPEHPPNFLQTSAFQSYITPHAYLHENGTSEGSNSPIDRCSLMDAQLIDISKSEESSINADKFEEVFGNVSSQNGANEKDQLIESLRNDLAGLKAVNERLESESKSRLEQYESRILHMEHESEQAKHLLNQISEQNLRCLEQTEQLQNDNNQQTVAKLEETEKRAQSGEERFKKMKLVYSKLRQEHIESLTKLNSLQKELQLTTDCTLNHNSELKTLQLELTACRNHEQDVVQQLNEQLTQTKIDAHDLATDLECTKSSLHFAQTEIRANKSDLEQLNAKMFQIFAALCCASARIVDDALEQFDNPAHLTVICTPEFMLTRTGPLLEELQSFAHNFASVHTDSRGPDANVVGSLATFSHCLSEVILHTKATVNAAPVDRIDDLVSLCRSVSDSAKTIFGDLASQGDGWISVRDKLPSLKTDLEHLECKFRDLLGKMGDIDETELGSEMDREMRKMDEEMKNAVHKIQKILSASRSVDTGLALEVNEKVLDSCSTLMNAIMQLVAKARDLQQEIVANQRGTGSVQDFYRRNHHWSQGLLSGAKAVGVAANFLVHSADRAVSNDGKLTELIVASQELAASSAQLSISSKVKANRDSQRFVQLQTASKLVTEATASVVGTVQRALDTLQSREVLDFSHLSLHQAKKMEMDSQVKMLELESDLTKERLRLAELRKRHYHLDNSLQSDKENSPAN